MKKIIIYIKENSGISTVILLILALIVYFTGDNRYLIYPIIGVVFVFIILILRIAVSSKEEVQQPKTFDDILDYDLLREEQGTKGHNE